MRRLLVILCLGLGFGLVFLSLNGRVVAKSENSGEGGSQGSSSQHSGRSGENNRGNSGQGSSGEAVERDDLPPQARSVRLEGEDDDLQVQPLDDEGEELEFSEGDEVDSFEFESDEDDEDGDEVELKVEIKAKGNAALVIRNKLTAQTHFPLMVNLETNELIVTTPAGQKVVTVLPDQAVAHMLAAKVLDQLGGKGGIRWLETQEATASATPVATASAEPTPGASTEPSASPADELEEEEEGNILLTVDEEGELVYEISGIKFERLLGLIPIGLRRMVVVSAETGELLGINQGILTRLLDLLSV